MHVPKNCAEVRSSPLIVKTENKRTFIITNQTKRTVRILTVDGCLIKDKRPRCDYVFEVGEKNGCVVYLELKGSDVGYAFEQLVATLGYLAKNHQGCMKICHIVASRVPKAGPKVQILQLKMNRLHGARLYVGTTRVTVDIDTEPYS